MTTGDKWPTLFSPRSTPPGNAFPLSGKSVFCSQYFIIWSAYPCQVKLGKNYKFIERYISEDLWEKLLSTYRMDSYENIWEALFLCHQLFRAVSGEVAERLHYAYPEYDRNITKYTRDMYKKYTGKTGCLDSTYAADIEERREQ